MGPWTACSVTEDGEERNGRDARSLHYACATQITGSVRNTTFELMDDVQQTVELARPCARVV